MSINLDQLAGGGGGRTDPVGFSQKQRGIQDVTAALGEEHIATLLLLANSAQISEQQNDWAHDYKETTALSITEYIIHNDYPSGTGRVIFRPLDMAENLIKLERCFFTFRIGMVDGNNNPLNLNLMKFTTPTGDKAVVPLRTKFNGMSSLLKRIVLFINRNSLEIATSSHFHFEEQFIKRWLVTKEFLEWYVLDETFPERTSSVDMDTAHWSQITGDKTAYLDKNDTWFTTERERATNYTTMRQRVVEIAYRPFHPIFWSNYNRLMSGQSHNWLFEFCDYTNPCFAFRRNPAIGRLVTEPSMNTVTIKPELTQNQFFLCNITTPKQIMQTSNIVVDSVKLRNVYDSMDVPQYFFYVYLDVECDELVPTNRPITRDVHLIQTCRRLGFMVTPKPVASGNYGFGMVDPYSSAIVGLSFFRTTLNRDTGFNIEQPIMTEPTLTPMAQVQWAKTVDYLQPSITPFCVKNMNFNMTGWAKSYFTIWQGTDMDYLISKVRYQTDQSKNKIVVVWQINSEHVKTNPITKTLYKDNEMIVWYIKVNDRSYKVMNVNGQWGLHQIFPTGQGYNFPGGSSTQALQGNLLMTAMGQQALQKGAAYQQAVLGSPSGM